MTIAELPARIVAKIVVRGECWIWTAGKNERGYGLVSVKGKTRKAHQVVYELLVGPIPRGKELDHTCRDRACVRPLHLEPVTHLENVRRGRRGRLLTHCPAGHSYDQANTWIDGRGGRNCKTCKRERLREWRRQKRADVRG